MKTEAESTRQVFRSELWKSIFDIVRKIPRKYVEGDSEGDSMDYPSCTTEVERIAQLYSDQQNKELREALDFPFVCACKVSDNPCSPNCSCKNPVMSGGCLNCATYGNEEQKKNMAENIQQRLSEIQRLTKEVEELKIRARHAEKQLLSDTKKAWDDGADKREITRLRELLREIQLEAIGVGDSSLSAKILTKIDNALNPKP